MAVALQCNCFPASPVDSYKHYTMSLRYYRTEEVAKKSSKWKNTTLVKESIFTSFRVYLFTLPLYLKKYQILQETKYRRLPVMRVIIWDTNNRRVIKDYI